MRSAPAVPAAVLLLLLALASCDDPGAEVIITNVSTGRNPDNSVVVTVEAQGVEHADGDVGHYCVSAHFLGFSDLSITDPAPSYFPDQDVEIICGPPRSATRELTEAGATSQVVGVAGPLTDGDRRTFVFTSRRLDLKPATPLRVQGQVGTFISKWDTQTP